MVTRVLFSPRAHATLLVALASATRSEVGRRPAAPSSVLPGLGRYELLELVVVLSSEPLEFWSEPPFWFC